MSAFLLLRTDARDAIDRPAAARSQTADAAAPHAGITGSDPAELPRDNGRMETGALTDPTSRGGAKEKNAGAGPLYGNAGTSPTTYATIDRWRATPAPCWRLRGTAPEDFVVEVDSNEHTSGKSSVSLASIRDTFGWGTLFQFADAKSLQGKRIEFSADIRTADVQRGANLFLRADDEKGNAVAMDTMWYSFTEDRQDDRQVNRVVKGDTDWTTQRIVIDIPVNAVVISYGLGLDGPGKAWIDNAALEVAGPDTPITAFVRPAEMLRESGTFARDHSLPLPTNLDFELAGFAGGCDQSAPPK